MLFRSPGYCAAETCLVLLLCYSTYSWMETVTYLLDTYTHTHANWTLHTVCFVLSAPCVSCLSPPLQKDLLSFHIPPLSTLPPITFLNPLYHILSLVHLSLNLVLPLPPRSPSLFLSLHISLPLSLPLSLFLSPPSLLLSLSSLFLFSAAVSPSLSPCLCVLPLSPPFSLSPG